MYAYANNPSTPPLPPPNLGTAHPIVPSGSATVVSAHRIFPAGENKVGRLVDWLVRNPLED